MDTFDNDEVHTYVVIPPDGGWGFVVVFSSFICHFVIDGNIYTFGLFIQSLCKEFEVSVAYISAVGAVLNGVCYMVGPFVSACLNRYDFRFVAIMGCCTAATGYAVSAMTDDYWIYMIGQGVLLGTGFGMLYVPALVMPSIYFAKYRAVAVSIATCGTGCGALVVPKVVTVIIAELGWRNTYLFMICIVGIAALATLVFIPVQPKLIYNKNERMMAPRANRAASMAVYKLKRKRCLCCHYGNSYFPKTTDLINAEDAVIKDDHEIRKSMYGVQSSPSLGDADRRNFISNITFHAEKCNYFWYNCLSLLCCGCLQTNARPMYRDDIFYGHSIMMLSETKRRAFKMKTRIAQEEHVKLSKQAKDEYEKAEIARLKEAERVAKERAEEEKQKQKAEDDEYIRQFNMKVTHVTTDHELYDTFRPCCGCHTSGLRTLATMLDFRLLKSMAFLILCFNGFFFTIGYGIPFMFIHLRAQENGIPKDETIWYISMIGGANTIGRLIAGFLPCVVKVNCVMMISCCCFIQGIVTCCSGIIVDEWTQIVYASIYGVLAGPYHALRTVIVVEIFGLENLTNIFGLQLVLSGVAAAIGPTLAGYLRDTTHDYTLSFYMAGASIAASGILLSGIRPVRNWEVRKHLVDF